MDYCYKLLCLLAIKKDNLYFSILYNEWCHSQRNESIMKPVGKEADQPDNYLFILF